MPESPLARQILSANLIIDPVLQLSRFHNLQAAAAIEVDLTQFPHIKPLIDNIPLIDKEALEIAITFDKSDVDLFLRLKDAWVFVRWSDFEVWKNFDKVDIESLLDASKLKRIQEITGDDSIFVWKKSIPFSVLWTVLDISDEGVGRIEELTQLWAEIIFDDFEFIDGLSDIHFHLLKRVFWWWIWQNRDTDEKNYISFEKFRSIAIVDVVNMLRFQGKDFGTIFLSMYSIIEEYPDFRLTHDMVDITSFYKWFEDYLKILFPQKEYDWEWPNELTRRLFRIWDENRDSVVQKSSNCFLVAWLYGLIRNPYFLSNLNNDLTKQQWSWFQSTWTYAFPSWVDHVIRIHDIRSDHKTPSMMWYDSKEILDFAIWVKERHATWKWFYWVEVPHLLWEILRRYFTQQGKPRKSFIQKIQKEFDSGSGIFYRIWLEKERIKQSIQSIRWPIGYRILEAAHNLDNIDMISINIAALIKWAKNLSNQGGSMEEVFKKFLGNDEWKVYSTHSWEIWKIELIHALQLLKTWQAIIGMSIADKTKENPYFTLDGFKMARGHAYSIKSYNEKTRNIEIINPWDTSISKVFSINEFIKTFDKVIIAFKK